MANDDLIEPIWAAAPQPVEYTPIDPAVVVELDTDVAFDQGRWRHPTAVRRIRLDLAAEDLASLQG
jgi:hypothetical protein